MKIDRVKAKNEFMDYVEKYDSSNEKIKLLEDINFIWDFNETQWLDMYNKLLEYKNSNGHCNVPYKDGELGLWVSRQRKTYKSGALSNERIKLLEGINFAWSAKTN